MNNEVKLEIKNAKEKGFIVEEIADALNLKVEEVEEVINEQEEGK